MQSKRNDASLPTGERKPSTSDLLTADGTMNVEQARWSVRRGRDLWNGACAVVAVASASLGIAASPHNFSAKRARRDLARLAEATTVVCGQ